jgi:hypothetical protein
MVGIQTRCTLYTDLFERTHLMIDVFRVSGYVVSHRAAVDPYQRTRP